MRDGDGLRGIQGAVDIVVVDAVAGAANPARLTNAAPISYPALR